ncbi:MAG: hypothetical protein OJF59_000828 [Cytophagales bacterium]|jgi:hypothetical protein|nr:MAG: hypothetical protein OJF59_000828 [Cytophagales bacterium]
MSRLVIPSKLLERLRRSLFKDENESFAILIGRSIFKNGRLIRLIAREIIEPESDAYEIRTATRIQITPHFIAQIAQRSRRSGESLVFVHSHPFPFNEFSKTDDEGEVVLANFFKQRTPNTVHAALLLTPEKSLARILGERKYLSVIGVGSEFYLDRIQKQSEPNQIYDRQVRAFGQEGQKIVESLRIGIVGLGGTGSVVAQQLAHLGVRDFLLIDPDVLEESNLNRVVGASRDDIGKDKVTITKELINRINPEAKVETAKESVLRNSIAEFLLDTDFTFSCTDSHGSRAVLNQLAYQYLLPIIDMGVVIAVRGQKIENIAARTQLLAPDLACMVCGNLLNYEEVRRDLLSDFERKNDPYITGATEPAPSVISLNSTVASMAITMFLNSVVGIPGTARLINYNAINGTSRAAVCPKHPTCVVCSMNGSFARADEWQLPGRLD